MTLLLYFATALLCNSTLKDKTIHLIQNIFLDFAVILKNPTGITDQDVRILGTPKPKLRNCVICPYTLSDRLCGGRHILVYSCKSMPIPPIALKNFKIFILKIYFLFAINTNIICRSWFAILT